MPSRVQIRRVIFFFVLHSTTEWLYLRSNVLHILNGGGIRDELDRAAGQLVKVAEPDLV